MLVQPDVVEEVRLGNDIVDVVSSYVSLKQKGNTYVGLCPFHNEKTPSFSVSADKQMFYCFGCGAGGNVFGFLMKMENIDFKEALSQLASRIHYTLPEYSAESKERAVKRAKLFEINKAAARYFYECLKGDEGEKARKYLDERRVLGQTVVKFGLGYAPNSRDGLFSHLLGKGFDIESVVALNLAMEAKSGNGYLDRFFGRLMFPIFDVSGNVTGFGGRIIAEGEPKYLNSRETPVFDKSKNLYGINFAKRLGQGERALILVEGYMDVVMMFQAGFQNAVAALGTAFNVSHTWLLKKYCDTVVIAFDGDTAGVNATQRAIPILTAGGLKVKVLSLYGAKDPDEFVKLFGADKLKAQIDAAVSHTSFQIELIRKKHDLERAEEKVSFTKEASKLISQLDSALEQDVYIKHVAELSGVSNEAIKKEVDVSSAALINSPLNTRSRLGVSHASLGGDEKGVLLAKKRLMYLLTLNKALCDAVMEVLLPEEMGDELFSKLLQIIYEQNKKGLALYPAELLGRFETVEEQRLVSEVFVESGNDSEKQQVVSEKEVNDLVKRIKQSKILKDMAKATDGEMLKNLINIKENIKKLYINIHGG